MNGSEILLYYSLKFRGNWDKIHEAIQMREEVDEGEYKKLKDKVCSKYITMLDKKYPEYLKYSYKPPFVLYYYGDISLIKDCYKNLSVIGSRKYSEYGKECTEKIVGDVGKYFNIVSGLAMGIDSIAHRTALSVGGRTIAVLGNGIEFHYIEDNKPLYEEIRSKHLVLSEFPGWVNPTPENFPIRNRIIAALSRVLLVVEGKINSGTSITANQTLYNGGDVCCIPTKIGEDSICNYLIANGAYLVESSRDVFELLKFVPPQPVFKK